MKLPVKIIGLVSGILADYYTHAELNRQFQLCGYEGDPPGGNKTEKVSEWLRRSNNDLEDPAANFLELIEEFLEDDDRERSLLVGRKERTIGEWQRQLTDYLKKLG